MRSRRLYRQAIAAPKDVHSRQRSTDQAEIIASRRERRGAVGYSAVRRASSRRSRPDRRSTPVHAPMLRRRSILRRSPIARRSVDPLSSLIRLSPLFRHHKQAPGSPSTLDASDWRPGGHHPPVADTKAGQSQGGAYSRAARDRRIVPAALEPAKRRATMLHPRPAAVVVCPARKGKGQRGRLCASVQPPGSWHPMNRSTERDRSRSPAQHATLTGAGVCRCSPYTNSTGGARISLRSPPTRCCTS